MRPMECTQSLRRPCQPGKGSLAIVPVTFLAGFHALPHIIPSLSPGHRPLKAEIAGSNPARAPQGKGEALVLAIPLMLKVMAVGPDAPYSFACRAS